MTIGGWIVFAVIAIMILAFGIGLGVVFASDGRNGSIGIGIVFIVVSVALVGALYVGMNWYYTATESGKRAFKTQKSNLEAGIERSVKVYDMNGDLLQEYSGRFDVAYNSDRILFDDEDGKRHVIYYPTGTVIIDEK